MRYDERKAYVFVDDFLQIIGENCCEYHKLSESTVQLALIGLVQLGWSSRWLSGTPEDFHRVSNSAFNIYRASFYEKAIKELTMSCDNEIRAGLESLGASILAGFQALANKQSGGCGCEDIPGSGHGSGGAGTNTGNPSDTGGQWGNPSADPLPGFETKEESDAYQCSMAHKILEDIKGDISTISTLSIVGLVATEIAAVLIPLLFTPLAWVDVVLLCAIVLEAVVLGLSYAEVIEHLEEKENDYICSLLSGGDASSSIDNFRSKVEELVPEDGDFPDPVSQYLVTRFINSFATYDSINRLFDKVSYSLPEEDCAACSGSFFYGCYAGSWDEGTETSYGVEIQGGEAESGVWLMSYGQTGHNGTYTYTLVSGSVTPPAAVPDFCYAVRDNSLAWDSFCGSGNGTVWWSDLASDFTGPDTWEDDHVFQIRSGSPFTIRIDYTPA